ncbi:MAG: protein NrnU [Betaproteobacteria bacterium]|nr:protein NrnU [Betaproteobacteria bacterium]
MTWLIAGLLIFLGVHSIRIFDEALRTRLVERWGEKPWKGIYSLLSVLGFLVLIYGYGQARMQPIPLYELPLGFRHASSLLVWFAMILVIAAYVPDNWFKTRLRHPMVLGVKLWAFAHLLSNGTAADVLLFGGFLLWSIASFRAAKKRDKEAASSFPEPTPEVGLSRPRSKASATVIAVVLGSLIWAGFLLDWHASLIGVSPMAIPVQVTK